jgi:hypothetical protein
MLGDKTKINNIKTANVFKLPVDVLHEALMYRSTSDTNNLFPRPC